MRAIVNGKEMFLAEGMKVRHALAALAEGDCNFARWIVRDQWGNVIGLDGALRDGVSITAEKIVCRKDEA